MTAVSGTRGASAPERQAPRFRSVWKTGAVAGLIGSAAVALAQGIADLVLGRPLFHTPEILGGGFGGFGAGSPAVGSVGPILLFTLFHVAAFVVIGIALAAASRSRTPRRFHWTSGLLFVAVFFGSATMAEAFDPLERALPSWSIVVANLAALALMGWVLRPCDEPESRDGR